MHYKLNVLKLVGYFLRDIANSLTLIFLSQISSQEICYVYLLFLLSVLFFSHFIRIIESFVSQLLFSSSC